MNEPTLFEKLEKAEGVIADLSAKLETAAANAKAAEELANAAQVEISAKEASLKNLADKFAALEAEKAKAEQDAKDADAKASESAEKLAKLEKAVASNPAFADASAGRQPITSPAGKSFNQVSAEEFRQMSPEQKTAFAKSGGRIA